MSKQSVGIIFGGKSSEHEVSLQSAKNIVDAIDREVYKVVLIGIDQAGEWFLYDEDNYLINAEDPERIRLSESKDPITMTLGDAGGKLIHAKTGKHVATIDIAFPIVHGTFGEDGSLQGMLRMANIPYVGPNVLSSSICMDKDIAKRLLQLADIQVAEGLTFHSEEKQTINFATVTEKLGTPLFIKPANQGSSVGVNKVEMKDEFDAAIEEAFQYDHKLVVEEAIDGREIECSVLGNEQPLASALGEISPQTEFYSYESKYIDDEGADLQIPAKLPEETVQKIQDISIKAYQTLQCEGLARVDVFLTKDGNVYVNELNTLPGFTQISMYPKLWEESGIAYTELITRLIEYAKNRYEKDAALKSSVFNNQ